MAEGAAHSEHSTVALNHSLLQRTESAVVMATCRDVQQSQREIFDERRLTYLLIAENIDYVLQLYGLVGVTLTTNDS